jgi:hypothetical protein
VCVCLYIYIYIYIYIVELGCNIMKMNILCRQNMYCYIPEYNVLFNSKELFGTTECLPLCTRVAKTDLVLTGLDVYIHIRTV